MIGYKELLSNIKSAQAREAVIFTIYRKIFAGLHCLHYDISNLYNPILKQYFKEQDKREDNQTHAEINSFEKCGIYHRDIKSTNIVINYNNDLSI